MTKVGKGHAVVLGEFIEQAEGSDQ